MGLVVKALKIEIFLLSMIVLIGLAVRSRRSLFSSTQQLLFSMLGYTSAAYILFDMIWVLLDGVDGALGIAVNWISNAVSFSLFAIVCLTWFIYSETVQGSRLLASRYRVVLVASPTVLVVVLAFTSYWTHALFYIDSQGVYSRGFAYMIQPIVSYCYVIHTSLHAFVQSRRVESLQTKTIYRTLAFFAIPALVGGTFQVVYSLPGLCVGIMISILLLYIVFQEQLISTDPLTGLNNRNRFEIYILSLFSNVDQAKDVYLLVMDADGFKQINDRYGHVEGDHALQVISAALKEVCSASGSFIARYGGDEFVVLQKAIAEQDILHLCAAINDELARAEVPYLLRMSIGYARVGDGVDTWQDLLRAADAELYRVKREKKKVGVQIR
ncbi:MULTISPECIES: diguanylate cyclase domain-containing protein [unclassified Collinsella]|uniref:GGDEF domain-containing protein n=1 Tax=unclassified Collinsella TaxID=2637548 RepID=UPI003F911A44